MPEVLLETPTARLVVDPEAGGRAASLVVGGLELVARAGADAVQWGWYPMAPWPGRLRDNACTAEGRRHEFPATFDGWAIHGTVYDRPWTVVTATTSAVELSTPLGERWPWPGRAVLTWALHDDALRTTLRVESDGPAFPAEVGWHPWLRRELARGGPAVLDLPAQAMAERGPDHLPTGRLVPPTAGPHDDAFVVPDGRATVTWPGALTLECTTDCAWFVVFDELAEAVCLEPQTAAPDALNGTVGGAPFVVRPGRPRTATATWRWRLT